MSETIESSRGTRVNSSPESKRRASRAPVLPQGGRRPSVDTDTQHLRPVNAKASASNSSGGENLDGSSVSSGSPSPDPSPNGSPRKHHHRRKSHGHHHGNRKLSRRISLKKGHPALGTGMMMVTSSQTRDSFSHDPSPTLFGGTLRKISMKAFYFIFF